MLPELLTHHSITTFLSSTIYCTCRSCLVPLQGTVTSTSSLFSKLPAVSLLGFSQTPPANLPSIFLPHHLPLAKKLLPGSLNTTKCVFTTLRKKTKQNKKPALSMTPLICLFLWSLQYLLVSESQHKTTFLQSVWLQAFRIHSLFYWEYKCVMYSHCLAFVSLLLVWTVYSFSECIQLANPGSYNNYILIV